MLNKSILHLIILCVTMFILFVPIAVGTLFNNKLKTYTEDTENTQSFTEDFFNSFKYIKRT
jgi:hypothetical protein